MPKIQGPVVSSLPSASGLDAEPKRHPIYAFDFLDEPLLELRPFERYHELKTDAPDFFWNPTRGGFWVAAGTEVLREVMSQPELFNSGHITLPPRPSVRPYPSASNPPQHTATRQTLAKYFEPDAVRRLESRIRHWTETYLDALEDKTQCEFVEAVAARVPILVVMEYAGIPIERLEMWRDLLMRLTYAPKDWLDLLRAQKECVQVMADLIEEKRAAPGDDMLSALTHMKRDGRPIDNEELCGIAMNMFLGGFDTVTVALCFGMVHLAHDLPLQERMLEDPTCIPAVAEELLRKYGQLSVIRTATRDCEVDGSKVYAGDNILCMLPMVGLDDALNPRPLEVNIDLERRRHAAFGMGIHTCVGRHLARLELKIVYQRWLERIGTFRMAPDRPAPRLRVGTGSLSYESLWLAWDR